MFLFLFLNLKIEYIYNIFIIKYIDNKTLLYIQCIFSSVIH